jgi:hypothetical protein
MNTINSLTITLTQTTTSTTSTSRTDSHHRPEDSEISRPHDRQEHHGFRGGMLMRSVLHALQSFGFNLPGNNDTAPENGKTNTNSTSSDSSPTLGKVFEALHTFLHDLHQILKDIGSQAPASTTTDDTQQDTSEPAPAVPAETATTVTTQTASSIAVSSEQSAETPSSESQTGATNSASPSVPTETNVRSTLNTFVKDLRSALLQDHAGYSRFGGRHHGYNNFNVNLQNLITSLSNDNGENSRYSKLESDFTNLMNTLNKSDSAQPPTLLDFLKKLAGDAGEPNTEQTNTGSILAIQA